MAKLIDRLILAKNIILNRTPEDQSTQPYIFARGIRGDREPLKINFKRFYDIYEGNTDIKACVREWRDGVGAGGYTIRDIRTEERLPAVQNEIDKILNYSRIGEVATWNNLRRNTWKDLGITDNAFWYLVRNIAKTKVLGVERLDPRTMSIVADKHGNIYAYIQKMREGEAITFSPEEIIHFKTDVNNNNELFGDSPMSSLIWDALGDIEASKSNYFFFLNDARPATVYILEPSLSKENVQKAVDGIASQIKGSKNQGRGTVLQGVKEVKTLDLTRKDMQYLEGRAFSREKVAEAYDVPLFILGITDKVNNNNGEEIRSEYYNSTIINKEILFAEQITVGLLNRIGLEGKAEFVFNKQVFNFDAIKKDAREDYERGVLTLRQYKDKTMQPILPEDEANPLIDKHVFISGSPTTSEDVSNKNSIEPVPA